MSEIVAVRVVESPLGPLTIGADDRGIRVIDFGARGAPPGSPVDGSAPQMAAAVSAHLDRAEIELSEYFAGRRSEFGVPVHVEGSDFERASWEALGSIEYGTTISYAEQARRMGRPTAMRAVGSANGRNPLPIVIPCHRVIAADGSLGGYSGGLEIKRWLLDHEQRHRGSSTRSVAASVTA